MDILDLFYKGGPAMWPLLALSILALSVIFERLWFWLRILTQEQEIVNRVLDAAGENWEVAADIARQATNQPIGRFLYAPLKLVKSDPETFRLALEATAEDELAGMRRGEKLLEAVIALAPMLGLLGTVLGLQQSVGNLKLGEFGTNAVADVPAGIGTALITTAAGLIIAIVGLVFYRLFQSFVVNQVKVFRKAGNELELLYRQSPPDFSNSTSIILREPPKENFNPPRKRGRNKFSSSPEVSEGNDSVDPEQ
ncbi:MULTISPECIES: MotA/TolQ/ExbB proton channel family protein [Calothrix]|uniref:MotA/TolQ/ExbB proton channel family protein n=2 Tax=Calothrix TaxID=1186 RepID=A0ABR8A9S0_9CYAN|nr:MULTISPECIES: MotA/TolQ/ExbB proton channel family protein [Calothrix]MBD2196200.1 MotA/TolQ/ExbB proton channel family protein [Calothrix parietina FACHB-288]MBD2224853.1 MotA/TolQ/ExbB proton channel family protein [Calothrix anomala FACHB-343]